MHDLPGPEGRGRYLSPALREEFAQLSRALVFEDPHLQLDLVIETPILGDVVEAPGGTCFQIGCTESDSFQPRQHSRPGTHSARFEGHDQGVSCQTPVPVIPGRSRENQDLGVGGRILQLFPAVVVGSNHLALRVEEHGTHRNVAVGGCQGGFGEGGSHSRFELGMIHRALHYVAVGGIA